MRDELTGAVEGIARLADPADRAVRIAAVLRDLDEVRRRAVQVRAEVVRQLRGQGMSHAEIALLLGVHRGTAQQIAEGRQTGRRRLTPEGQ